MKKLFSLRMILSIVLTLTMLMSIAVTAPVTVSAAGTFTQNFNVSSNEELVNALYSISTAESGNYSITLTADIERSGGYGINKNSITIFGEGHTISFSGANQRLDVYSGATLNLGASDYTKSLTLKGDNIKDNDNPGLIHINGTSSVCNMYSGVTVKDHKGSNYLGGGVTVESGTFNMYGGTIDNCGIDGGSVCYGGGVSVFGQGKFVMNGGTISNCYALTDYYHPGDSYFDNYAGYMYKTAMGGGVFVTGQSTFIMNGGTITKNKSTRRGGGISVSASKSEGFGYVKSKVVINGGTISDNESNIGGGIYVNGYEFPYVSGITFNAKVNGTIEVDQPIEIGTNSVNSVNINKKAIYSTGADEEPAEGFNMTGGIVTGNTANIAGGGIEIHRVREKALLSNVVITNNTAKYTSGITNTNTDTEGYFHYSENGTGGGILVGQEFSNVTIENCKINSNTAEKNGGGVSLITAKTYPTLINNSTINSNTSGARGAGIYYDSTSKLQMSGADVVQGNIYDNHLNNVNVLSTTNPIYIVGDLTGSQIGLSDPRLWDDDLTDAEAPDDGSAELLTSGYRQNNPEVHPNQYFTSDHESWIVERTKAEEKEVDDTTKSYRQYTAKRYPVTSGSNPAGHSYDYIYLKAQKPGTGVISTLQQIFDELVYRYSNKGYTVVYNQDKYKRYTAPDGTTITIQLSNSYVSLVFSKNSKSVTYYGRTTYQSRASEGDLYLSINSSGDISNYTFSDQADNELVSIKYYNANPNDNYILEYDELGKVTAKLVFEGGRYNYTTVYGKKIAVTGDENEVRLVRKTTVDYHINNDDKADIYTDDIFTPEVGHDVNIGDTIEEFKNIPKLKDPDGYIFKGWYYDPISDDNPVNFGVDKYEKGKDIYAHWEPVAEIEQDPADGKQLPAEMNGKYRNFGLFGVQIRPEGYVDNNVDGVTKYSTGLRFITSLSDEMLSTIGGLYDAKVNGHSVEYGYVVATKDTVDKYVEHYGNLGYDMSDYTLQYKGTDVNGVDTTQKTSPDNDYRYIDNVDCTAGDGLVDHDHFNSTTNGYRLSTMVIHYDNEAEMGMKICARAYLRYYDANGVLRTFYNDYDGTTTYGGCCTSYNEAKSGGATDTDTYYVKGA